MIPDFYTPNPKWRQQVEEIIYLLGRVRAMEEVSGLSLELRRTNRIGSVHSSTAIEGNALTLGQVEDLANGVPVFAPLRDTKEVENALAVYEAIESLDPWSADDFLRAHALLTEGLVRESGEFRTIDVDLVGPTGKILHSGSSFKKVPGLIAWLFAWGKASTDHPLIVSSAAHFLIEYIHPFRDGNGRIGRLWQTLILSKWRPVFAWMPTETLIRKNQAAYYDALQASHEPEIDAAPFIDYMLLVITESLKAYESRARYTARYGGVNGGVNGGQNSAILEALRQDPALTSAALAARLGKGKRTIERQLAALKVNGLIRREGSAKSGRWVVIEE